MSGCDRVPFVDSRVGVAAWDERFPDVAPRQNTTSIPVDRVRRSGADVREIPARVTP